MFCGLQITKDAYEEPTIKRSRSHNYVSKEVINVRENVGFIEVANFQNINLKVKMQENF